MTMFASAFAFRAANQRPILQACRVALISLVASFVLSATAQAASYAYDFELTLMSEQVRVSPVVDTTNRAPSLAQPEWLDLSFFGPDAGPVGLGIDPGETIRGALHLNGPDDFGLTLSNFAPSIDFAFVTSKDPASGDVALAFSSTSRQYDFNFIADNGMLRTDNLGELVAPDGSVFFYAGYTAEFALVPLGGAPERLATMPLPAGPLLLLAALGGLVACKARRRSTA